MTHPLTPRERVRKAIIDVMKPKDADITLGRVDTCTDAILTALASGSGDHAELIEDAMDALQIIDAFPSNQGEVEGRITEKGDRMLSSCTKDVRRALETLLAENAALRAESENARTVVAWANNSLFGSCGYFHGDPFDGLHLARPIEALKEQATEAERKLAETVGRSDDLLKALEWYGEQARLARLIHSEGDAGRHALADDGGSRARAFIANHETIRINAWLSKEAERG